MIIFKLLLSNMIQVRIIVKYSDGNPQMSSFQTASIKINIAAGSRFTDDGGHIHNIRR